MKKTILAMLMLSTIATYVFGQTKTEEKMYSVPVPAVPCAGLANMGEGDVSWGAELINHSIQLMPAPGQQFVDSLKAAKLQQKEAYQSAFGAVNRTTSVSPVMGTNFVANLYSSTSPSNNSIAVSDTGYVVSVNSTGIAFYKTNGTLMYSNLIANFMPFGAISVTNPVVIYDTRADRFIFVCQQMPIVDTGKIYICFSRSNNPGASVGWFCYALRGNPAGGGDGFDFPRVSVNDSELFITGNLYAGLPSSPYFDKPIIHQIDKLAGYAGAAMSSIYYPYIVGNPFSMLPIAHGQAAGINTGMHLISTTSTGGNTLNLYKITGNLFSSPSMTYSTVATSTYAVPANSHQLGTSGLLNVGDCRALSGFFLDSTIHYVLNTDAGSGFSGISYNRYSLRTNTVASSTLGVSGKDYAYPSVVSYATTPTNPSVIIGFGVSGSAQYPEVRAVNCDSAMGWSGTTLVKASSSYVGGTTGVFPWGNYSGSSRRHNSSAPSVWINSGFGNTAHNWDTYVAEIHDAATTPCPQPTGLYVNGLTTYSAIAHWSAVGGALNYNVQYKPSSGSTWTTVSTTALLKTITGLTYGTHYDYQVQAQCSDSSWGSYMADTFTTKFPPVTVNELGHNAAARVFPNPVTSSFNVQFNLEAHCNLVIDVTDIAGRVVKQLYNGAAEAGLNEFSFNKSNLANGVYMLSITADSKSIKKEKIVIAD